MNDDAQTFIDELIGDEGQYSDNSNDAGGPTMWGITQATARAFGYVGPMQTMPRDMAVRIYTERYWTAPHFDQVDSIDAKIASKLLNFGANAGPATAAKMLQRALNVLRGQDYAAITADGVIGKMTLSAMTRFIAKRGDVGRKVLYNMICGQQSVYYIECAEKREANEAFEFGWQANRAFEGVEA